MTTTPGPRKHPASYLWPGPARDRLMACMAAEADADLDAARSHHRTLARPPDHQQALELWELDSVHRGGVEVPGYAWSRWMVRQAYRWLRFEPHPVIEKVGWAAVNAGYPPGVGFPEWPEKEEKQIFEGALTGWLARQLGAFDYGGLRDFLARHAGPALLGLGEDMDAWAAEPMGGWVVEQKRPGYLVVADAAGDAGELPVLDLDSDLGVGDSLLARVMPIEEAPGWVFDSRPVAVDPRTAREVARSFGLGMLWVTAVWSAVEDGRLPLGFDLEQPSLLTSDRSVQGFRDELAAGLGASA